MVTDGFFEWANIDGERFGIERLVNAIEGLHHLDAEQMINEMYKEVLNFTAGAPQMDDVTMVIVKRCK